MPLTGYLIRNEYSLADSELYRAADRDDPEALLEGVAMAGLVGILRQLGDLAEFAAEIFHSLHEELMVTAARGHGLVIRVQQVEAEFPKIEKAILSQNNHSLFLHNAGSDWHPNLRMDQNLITRGDLPHFVMDSYEECRGPPRLFLLDKFDSAGAGACLKRYSDPSLFKIEFTASETTKMESQKERKTRKIKKKGSLLRNGETLDTYPTSHVKLHQLFLEERRLSSNNIPAGQVKLKRPLNGSNFDSRTGKSYMEKFLETYSLEYELFCESSATSQCLKIRSSDSCELGLEIREISAESPGNKFLQRDGSPNVSSTGQEAILEPSIVEVSKDVNEDERLNKLPDINTDGGLENASSKFYGVEIQKKLAIDGESNIETNTEGYQSEDITKDDVIEGEIVNKVPDPKTNSEREKDLSNLYVADDRMKLAIDGERNTEANAEGYHSDDLTSEVDNYMDALTVMESERETDTDCRPKKKQDFFKFGTLGMDPDIYKRDQDLQSQFSDSLSIGNSSASDEEINSINKRVSSVSYSDTLSNVAENVPMGAKFYTSNEIYLAEIDDISTKKLSRNEDGTRTISPEYLVRNGTCNEVSNIPRYRSEFGVASCDSCLTSTNSTPLHLDAGETLSEVQLGGSESIEVTSDFVEAVKSSNREQDGGNLDGNLPHTTNVSGLSLQNRDVSHSTMSVDNQPLPKLDDGILIVSSAALLHQSDVSDLSLDKKCEDNSPEDVLPIDSATAEDGPTENLISRKLDLPTSVTLETEEQVDGFNGQEVEACSGFESPPRQPDSMTTCFLDDVDPGSSIVMVDNIVLSTGEATGNLMTDSPDTCEFAEHIFQEMADVIPPLKLNSAEASIPCSEVKLLCENLETSSNIISYEEKNVPMPFVVPLNSSGTMGINMPLEFPSDFVKPASVTESHQLSTDSVTDYDKIIVCSDLISSQLENIIMVQEGCLSSSGVSAQNKVEITEESSPDCLTESDEQKELNQLTVVPISLNGDLCSPESVDISSSVFLDNVHDSSLCEETQKNLDTSEGTIAPASSKASDKKWESKSLSLISLPESTKYDISSPINFHQELGSPLEQSLELQPNELNMELLHEDEDRIRLESLHEDKDRVQSSALHCDQAHCLNHVDGNGCFGDISESCQAESLTHTSEAEFSTLAVAAVHSTEKPEPALDSLHSIFPCSDMLTEAFQPQNLEASSNRLALDIPLPDPNALQDNLEMPPLPPLPPIQWRIGKVQQTSEGEMLQRSLNEFSTVLPATEDKKARQESSTGGIAEHLNLFFPLSSTGEEKSQHVSGMLEGEALRHIHNPLLCQEPSLVNDEITQRGFLPSEGKIMQVENPFLAVPDTDDQRPDSHNLGAEMVRSRLHLSAPMTTIEDVNIRHASLSLSGEAEQDQHLDVDKLQHTLSKDQLIDVDELQHTSSNSEGKPVNLPDSFSPPPTGEYEQPGQHSPTPEGEILGQSTTEDGQPNGNYKAKRPRPKDPLIEAVASHDKSMLRKVTDRFRPVIEPKVEERDSLLEQIRTKSFNLKRTVVTRTSIQGPKTNLKVVAILEKANAIRQALAGSDEDDEDNWSEA